MLLRLLNPDVVFMSPVLSSMRDRFLTRSTLTPHRDTYPFIDPYRFRNALIGKIVLITNAHRGIGRASVLDFASAGATVVCVAHTMELLQPVLSELRIRGHSRAYGCIMDSSDPSSPAKLIEDVEQRIGVVDILLSINSGPSLSSIIHTENFTDWWSAVDLNLRQPIALIHAVLPSMIARGGGTIITTVFRTGATHIPFTTSASTAHSAMIRFHHGLDEEARHKGIYSYVVHPGLVASYLDDPGTSRHHASLFALEPRIQEEKTGFVADISADQWCSNGLSSGTFLALAADPRARVLSGLYVDAERDMGDLIEEVEKGEGSRVAGEKLYVLKVDEL
jgi:NAD(P)-dependent dehydrogenase (short-subunit alcohol dehydrogenase family)